MKDASLKYAAGFLMIVLTIGLGYFVEQSNFFPLITGIFIFFFIYLVSFNYFKKEKDIWFFIGLGVLLRFILLFSLPNLSDDIYRFIWDGRLLVNGTNPFDQLPSFYIEQGISIPGINQELFESLNSPNYFTIYPPICQGIFAFAVWIFPDSIWGCSVIIKSFFLLFEIGTISLMISLLKYFELPLRNVLLYVLNPLIILELMGNIHFEAAMIFFLLLGIWLLFKQQVYLSSISIAFSIASKLLPLMYLPFLIRRLGLQKSISYFLLMGVSLLFLFYPIFNGVFLSNIGSSLSLYFQKFEFNGSIYYLLRWVGHQFLGYNMIAKLGPALGFFILASICWTAWKEQNLQLRQLPLLILFSISLFLFCTTTIMPWYLSTLIAVCVFTPFRFPILWSALIFLTYINYSYTPYYENLWIVAIEYIFVLGWVIFELRRYSLNLWK